MIRDLRTPAPVPSAPHSGARPLAALVALVALAAPVALAGCPLFKSKDDRADAGASTAATVTAVAAATATGTAGPAPGPTATIPAGVLKAGTPCGLVPRVTNEELVGESVSLGEFSIDVYPYPNDPNLPAKTGVTKDEAEALCAATGKRLCTELEWERACKGAQNHAFEYGVSYSPQHCKADPSLLPNKREKCVSGFGVRDLHGLAFEWTASAWGRGTSGGLATVRGGPAAAGALQARCANGQGRPPATKANDVGFRCCGGPANAASVNLAPNKQPPMVEEPGLEASLGAAMLRAMPADHRKLEKGTAKFDKVWRWHPRDSEELVVGRWTGKLDAGGPFYELAVFKVCNGVPGLVARMKGPVESVGAPGAGAEVQKASARVKTESSEGDVTLTYSYGSVRIEEPAWIKAGNTLEVKGGAPAGLTFPKGLKRPRGR